MNIERIIENIKTFDYTSIDIDEFLDDRDCEEFDSEWGNVYKQIDRDELPDSIRVQVDKYRKEVFLAIDELIGVSELSEYISDDIELLMYADYVGINNEWFSKFVEKYENGELPTGIL